MKSFIIPFFLASLFACNNPQLSAQNDNSNADVSETFNKSKEYPLRNHHHSIRPLDVFKKFQTFNEKTLSGEGQAKKEPFVYVDDQDSIIYVRISSNPDSILCYHHEGNCWVNEIYSHMGNRWAPVLKNGYSANQSVGATRYIRYIQGDSIMEYCTTYISSNIYNRVLLKKGRMIRNISIDDDSNRIPPLDSIKAIIHNAVDMNSVPKNEKNAKMPKYPSWQYDFVVDRGQYIIINRNMREYFRCKITPLGEFGAQPGMEKYIKNYYDNDQDLIDYIGRKYL